MPSSNLRAAKLFDCSIVLLSVDAFIPQPATPPAISFFRCTNGTHLLTQLSKFHPQLPSPTSLYLGDCYLHTAFPRYPLPVKAQPPLSTRLFYLYRHAVNSVGRDGYHFW